MVQIIELCSPAGSQLLAAWMSRHHGAAGMHPMIWMVLWASSLLVRTLGEDADRQSEEVTGVPGAKVITTGSSSNSDDSAATSTAVSGVATSVGPSKTVWPWIEGDSKRRHDAKLPDHTTMAGTTAAWTIAVCVASVQVVFTTYSTHWSQVFGPSSLTGLCCSVQTCFAQSLCSS
jgi:hypothetical protein